MVKENDAAPAMDKTAWPERNQEGGNKKITHKENHQNTTMNGDDGDDDHGDYDDYDDEDEDEDE